MAQVPQVPVLLPWQVRRLGINQFRGPLGAVVALILLRRSLLVPAVLVQYLAVLVVRL
jgi:hypothetical protein